MSSWESRDESKTAELILLIAKHTEDDPTSGSTKLNKILYFAEISHLRRTGKPITGLEYQKQPHGPTLRRMPPIIRDLESQGAAKEIEEDYFGYAQKKLVALREPDLRHLSRGSRLGDKGQLERNRPEVTDALRERAHQLATDHA